MGALRGWYTNIKCKMKQLKEFFIPFKGLKQGKHTFEYKIDNSFFESFDYEDFNDVDVSVEVALNKMSTMMELDMRASGVVNVNCDITNEPFDQEINGDLHLVVKFGDEFNDEDDEILILAVPQKRVHPGVEDGSLDSPVLDKLKELQPKEEKIDEKNTDPRWDGLKKLLTDK